MPYVTIYRRPTASGDLFRQISGLGLPSPDDPEDPFGVSETSFTVPQAKLAEAQIDPPRAGDQIMDSAGRWWAVGADQEQDPDGYTVDCGGA